MDSIDLNGLKISLFDRLSLAEHLKTTIQNRQKEICYGYSLGTIALFKKEKKFYSIINSFDLMVTDGRFFYWFAQVIGARLKYDISIPNLTLLLLDIANANSFSVLLLGATAEVNIKAAENIRKKYLNIRLHEGIDGYFTDDMEPEIIDKINLLHPDILLIGISSPKKEQFAQKWKEKLDSRIIVPCGGMIDVIAGKTKTTPRLIKKLGLATPYRVLQEPKRLFWHNLWISAEIVFRVLPITLFKIKILRIKNFFIPSIYGIKRP